MPPPARTTQAKPRPRTVVQLLLIAVVVGCALVLVALLLQPTPDPRAVVAEAALAQPQRPQSAFAKPRRDVTIVSAFFDLARMGQKTKHEASFYLDAGAKGMLAIATPMVIFTDAPAEVARKRRQAAPDVPTLVVNISVLELDTAKLHLRRLTELAPRDPETSFGYSGLLFMIYHAKPELMLRAARLNPFRTSKFLWMDVGAIRDWGGIHKEDYMRQEWPAPEREWLLGRDNRIQLQGVAGRLGPCPNEARFVLAEDPLHVAQPQQRVADPIQVRIQPNNWWIAGSMWGGRGEDLVRYHEIYMHHLARYLQSERKEYALIDQYLMGALACHYNDFIEVIRAPAGCCADRVNRKWFFMLMFFKWSEYPKVPYTDEELRERGKQSAP